MKTLFEQEGEQYEMQDDYGLSCITLPQDATDIIKCPICGSDMYGNVNHKKHPDGGHYKDYFYYACKLCAAVIWPKFMDMR